MSVLAYDPMLPEEAFAASGSRSVSLEELLASSDVVTLHAPSTPATCGLINADRLQLMKRTAFLINTARGDLVDEDALYHALRTGGIAGAGLDAYVEEPPTKSRLLTLPNVVATPHIGSHTEEAVTRASVMSAQNVVEVLRTGAAKWPAW
jgi:D-3-phosphoglycerate dehydrogenase